MYPLLEATAHRRHTSLETLDPNRNFAVWWYGGIRKNPQDQTVPLVRVFLRELLSHGEYGLNCFRDVGINHLGRLRIGTIWRGGACSTQLHFERQTFRVRIASFKITSQAECNHNYPSSIINPHIYPLPYMEKDRSKVLIFTEALDRRSVMVPSLEFFTRCYGRSGEVNRVLATYEWEEVTKRLLLPCNWTSTPGSWPVAIPANVYNDDAIFLAHLKYEAYAEKAAKAIYSQLNNDFTKYTWVFPPVRPWHQDEVDLIVSGLWIDSARTRFLGLRIIGCSSPAGPPIDAQRIENPGQAEEAAPDGAPESTWRGGKFASENIDAFNVALTVDRPPDHITGRVHFKEDAFEDTNTTRKVIYRRLSEASSRPTPGHADDLPTEVSTGQRQGSPSGIGSASIHSRKLLPSDGALLDIWNALLHLRRYQSEVINYLGWYTSSTGAQDATSDSQPLLESLRPYSREELKLLRAGQRSRIYLDFEKGITRSLLIARICTPAAEIFIFELERKIVSGQELAGDAFSGLAICRPPEEALRPWVEDVIKAIRIECGVMKRVVGNRLARADNGKIGDYRRSSSVHDELSGQSTAINALAKVGVHVHRD